MGECECARTSLQHRYASQIWQTPAVTKCDRYAAKNTLFPLLHRPSFRSPPFSSSLNSGLKRTFWTRPASKAGECVSLDLSSTRMISFGGSLCEAATCGCCCHSACRKLLYGNEKSMTNSWRTFNDIHIQHSKGRIKTFSAGSQGLGGVHARAYTHTHTRALMHAQKEEGTNEK